MHQKEKKTHWTDKIKWSGKKDFDYFSSKRASLLKSVEGQISVSFDNHKPHNGPLSPGCIICSKGKWACVYITKKCTTDCFFCPQAREHGEESTPKANGVTFNDPLDFVAYINTFGIEGVGFSGGEPLLVANRLLAFTDTIRQHLGYKYYIWMYTNGHLVDKEILKQLKSSGINEIRFDIYATGYRLEPVILATRYIENVTVEIPAIPEDINILKDCLLPLKKAGVRFLNLHQIILSKHNYTSFLTRDYIYARSQQFDPRVLDSELMALEIMKYSLDKKIDLPINYCSKPYKNRFQDSGINRVALEHVCLDHEEISDMGYLKQLSVTSSPSSIRKIQKVAIQNGLCKRLYVHGDNLTEAFIHSSLLEYINCEKYSFNLGYYSPRLKDYSDFSTEGRGITLETGKRIKVLLKKVFEKKGLTIKAVKQFEDFFCDTMNIERDVVPVTF